MGVARGDCSAGAAPAAIDVCAGVEMRRAVGRVSLASVRTWNTHSCSCAGIVPSAVERQLERNLTKGFGPSCPPNPRPRLAHLTPRPRVAVRLLRADRASLLADARAGSPSLRGKGETVALPFLPGFRFCVRHRRLKPRLWASGHDVRRRGHSECDRVLPFLPGLRFCCQSAKDHCRFCRDLSFVCQCGRSRCRFCRDSCV